MAVKHLLALAAVLAIVHAVNLPVPRKVLGSDNVHITADWTDNGIAAAVSPLTFRLFFFQRNLDVLNQIYEDRTNPSSPNYRNWLSIQELNDIVAPSQLSKKQVLNWLKSNGVSSAQIKDNGDAFVIESNVAVATALFQTEFHEFTSKTGQTAIRQVGEYSVPVSVSKVIQFVSGITSFPVNKRLSAHPRAPEDNENGKVVPYVINELYGIPSNINYIFNSSISLAEFQNDRSFAAADLTDFQSENDLPNNPVYKIVGPYQPNVPDAESTLDVQYGSGVAVNSSVWFWTVDGWMLEFANDFVNTAVVPYVVSMSWGWTETDQCQITSCNGLTSAQYVDRVNTEFQMIGLRGVTLYASSGDQGAPGDGDPYCVNTKQPISSIFPGASPYVTSVGATMLVPPASGVSASAASDAAPPICTTYDCADPSWPEVACSYPDALITTGGGFSAYSPRPSWQNSVVSSYLSSQASTLPPATAFNATNRGFPDVSALGHNYLIRLSGRWTIVDGTSCSSPVWAGMTGLWNDALIAAGKPTLGPVNALLYGMYASTPSTFKDITSGNNKCSESACCKYGFTTAPGWDAVTGLGVPNFQAIANYIQANLINA
jgi:subtilase family serine protease